ncbi:MAG: Alpha-amylase [Streblomastix strix]|uniref:alpha-amylase n=1 Tax=Streblomastix strix TaxID=222440 RepID=A0A5J4WMY2_9EUKA|nr:MAG: Alpha-amylase [Streblomastix strix]
MLYFVNIISLMFVYLCNAHISTDSLSGNTQLIGKSKEEWKTRIIYQLITDRFARTDGENASCDLHKMCGGSFRGIINKLDYIQGLGMNAIWISPILKNRENIYHGYETLDFYQINSNFGSEQDLIELIKELHKREMWIMVDVVFNHVAMTNYSQINPFNKEEYYHQPPCKIVDYSNQSQVENCWLSGLPDLKQENEYVQNTLLDWIEQLIQKYNIDGLRVDTVKHVPIWFWEKLHKRLPNIYMLGELLDENVDYISRYKDVMNGILNYPMYGALKRVFQNGESCRQIRDVNNTIEMKQFDTRALGGFLDNHDQPRFRSVQKNTNIFKSALTYIMLADSIPIIYYGSEQGYSGGNDPQNREPLWWCGYKYVDLYAFIKILAALRRTYIKPTLNFIDRYKSDHFFAFSRGDNILVCTTNTANNFSIDITYSPFKQGDLLTEMLSKETVVAGEMGSIHVEMKQGMPRVFIKKN